MQHFLYGTGVVAALDNFNCDALAASESCSAVSEAINGHILDLVNFEILAQLGDHFHHFLYWVERVAIFGRLIFLLLLFLSERIVTNLRGSRYLRVYLYSLFSTILSRLRIMSCLTLFWLRFFFCWLKTSGSLLL